MTTTTATLTNTDADAAAVAALPARLTEAWAAQDGQAFAEVFTEDGTLILPGLYMKGRAEIAAYFTDGFAGQYRGTQVIGWPLEVRFLGADVALLIKEGGVIEAGATEPAGSAIIRSTVTAVRQDGEWLIAGYQNSPRDT